MMIMTTMIIILIVVVIDIIVFLSDYMLLTHKDLSHKLNHLHFCKVFVYIVLINIHFCIKKNRSFLHMENSSSDMV